MLQANFLHQRAFPIAYNVCKVHCEKCLSRTVQLWTSKSSDVHAISALCSAQLISHDSLQRESRLWLQDGALIPCMYPEAHLPHLTTVGLADHHATRITRACCMRSPQGRHRLSEAPGQFREVVLAFNEALRLPGQCIPLSMHRLHGPWSCSPQPSVSTAAAR